MPFYALLIQGIPRLVHVADNEIQPVESINQGPFDQQAVSVNSENAVLPDLDSLEQTVLRAI